MNESYIFPQDKEQFQLAILPVESKLGLFTDTVFTVIFKDSIHRQDLVALPDIREAIRSNRQTVEAVSTVIRKDYSPDEYRDRSNLKTVLSPREIALVQDALQQADIVVIPLVLNVRSLGMHTFGEMRFLVYDLHSGEWVLEGQHDFNVNQVGEYAAKDLTMMLIVYAWADYDQHYYQLFFEK